MNDDEAIRSIQAKIEREEALMTAAINMRSLPINEGHRSRIDSELRDNERNIKFFKERLDAIRQRKVQQGLGGMSLAEGDDGGPPPAPPPKDPNAAWGDQGSYGAGSAQYSQIGQHGDLMPPRHPYAPPGPGAAVPKPRPNFTKLGSCPHAQAEPSASALAAQWTGQGGVVLTDACSRSDQI